MLGVALAAWLLAGFSGPWKRWALVGIALVCVLPWILWESAFPPAFDMTAYTNTVDYEFRDAAYADEFASLNGSSGQEE